MLIDRENHENWPPMNNTCYTVYSPLYVNIYRPVNVTIQGIIIEQDCILVVK